MLDSPFWTARSQALSVEERNKMAERLYRSRNQTERDSFLAGFNSETGEPSLIHKSSLSEHAWILGGTGSGKSSKAIAPMAEWLMRSGDELVVIVDLKGDRYLFNMMRAASEENRRKFKYFISFPGQASYVFNPLAQSSMDSLDVQDFSETFLKSMGLQHAMAYAQSYYTRQNREAAVRAFRSPALNFHDLAHQMESPNFFDHQAQEEAAGEVVQTMRSLARNPLLNLTENQNPEAFRNQIDIPTAVENGKETIYFYLPSALQDSSASEVANLVLYTLFQSCFLRAHRLGKRQVYLFLDEAQVMVNGSFKRVLQQARSLGLAVILANQSAADLDVSEEGLSKTIRSLTRVQWLFGTSDPEYASDVSKSSGTCERHKVSRNGEVSLQGNFVSFQDEAVSLSLEEQPRITPDDIRRLTNDDDLSLLSMSKDAGLTQYGGFPTFIRTGHYISEDELALRTSRPWPGLTSETVEAPFNPVRGHSDFEYQVDTEMSVIPTSRWRRSQESFRSVFLANDEES